MCRAKDSPRRHWQPIACNKLLRSLWSPFWRRCVVWDSQLKCTTIYMWKITSQYREDMYRHPHPHHNTPLILLTQQQKHHRHQPWPTAGPLREEVLVGITFLLFIKKDTEDHRTNPHTGVSTLLTRTDETAVTQQKCHNAATGPSRHLLRASLPFMFAFISPFLSDLAEASPGGVGIDVLCWITASSANHETNPIETNIGTMEIHERYACDCRFSPGCGTLRAHKLESTGELQNGS